jgi:hypothetical protein
VDETHKSGPTNGFQFYMPMTLSGTDYNYAVAGFTVLMRLNKQSNQLLIALSPEGR